VVGVDNNPISDRHHNQPTPKNNENEQGELKREQQAEQELIIR